MKKTILSVGILLILVLVAGAAFYVYEKTHGYLPTSMANYQNTTPTNVLLESNTDFATANNYQGSGNFAAAKQFYQQALLTAQDSTQSAQIEFYIASVDQQLGNYSDAITVLKQIAATNAQWPIMQAYAVQAMGLIYYQDPSDQAITKQIFSTAPYSSFYTATSTVDSAYRALFTYAASIYPLGVSESYLAKWDAADLRTNLHGATTTPAGIAKVNDIYQALAAADKDLVRIGNDPVGGNDIPNIDTTEGIIFGYLATIGAADPQAAETKFQDAIQYMAARNLVPGELTNYYYAAFLWNMYGKTKLPQITQLLDPFVVSNEKNIYPNVPAFFTDARTDQGQLVAHKNLVALGNIDPSFKTYLISLGWQPFDFAGN